MNEMQIHIPLMRDCCHFLPKDAVIVDSVVESDNLNQKVLIEMVPFLEEKDGNRISGEAVLKRAKRLGGRLGLGAAHTILNNPSVVSADFREHVLLFPGLVITLPVKGELKRCIPVLYPENERYDLDFVWLGHESFGAGCLIVCAVGWLE